MSKLNNIGGEFESYKNFSSKEYTNNFKTGTWFSCGRHALNEIFIQLKKKKIKNIYLPIYACQSINNILKNFKFKKFYYDIDKNLNQKLNVINKNSAIIIINYFGIKNNFNLKKISHKAIIINDLSHSFFQKKIKMQKNQYYFFSLRKFGLFNYGGWCNVKSNAKIIKNTNMLTNLSKKIRKVKQEYLDKQKKRNLKHEIKIINKFKDFDQKLYNFKSPIHKKNIKMIKKINFFKIKKIRRKNFVYLKNKLPLNLILNLNLEKQGIPLGFFLVVKKNRNKLIKKLKSNGIFCPVHWVVPKRFKNKKKFSYSLSKSLLTIPIDHRYNNNHLNKIIRNIYEFFPKNTYIR